MADDSKQKRREQFLWETTSDLLAVLPADTEVAAYRCGVLHWFNPELLKAVSGKGRLSQLRRGKQPDDERRPDILYEELLELPFVEEYPGGAYGFHEMTRDVLQKHLWAHEPEFCEAVSAAAWEYFDQQLQEQDIPDADDVFEWAYHFFNIDEVQAVEVISSLLDSFRQRGLMAQWRALVRAAQEQITSGRFSPEVTSAVDLWALDDAFFSVDLERVEALANEMLSKPDRVVNTEMKGVVAERLADAYYQNGRYNKAFVHYQNTLQRFKQLRLPGEMAIALQGMGNVSYQQGNLKSAEGDYFQALDLALSSYILPDDNGEMPDLDDFAAHDPSAWMRLVGEAEDATNADEAEQKATDRESALEGANESDDSNAPIILVYYCITGKDVVAMEEVDGEAEIPMLMLRWVDQTIANIWLQLGLCFKGMDQYDQAAAAARLAWQMFIDLDDAYSIQQALQLLLNLGAITGERPFTEAGEDVQKGLLELARERANRPAELAALLGLAGVYIDQSSYEEAKTCYRESIELAANLEDKLGRAAALEGLASLGGVDNDWVKALELLNEATAIYCSLSHREGEAQALLTTGQVEMSRHRPLLAEKNFRRAYDLYTDLRVVNGQIESLQGLADVASYSMDNSGAIGYLKQGIALARKSTVPLLVEKGKESLAKAYLSAQDLDAARSTYEDVLNYYRKTGQRAFEAGLLIGLGDVELEAQKFKKAADDYSLARAIFSDLMDIEGELQSLIAILALEIERQQLDAAGAVAKEALELARKSNSIANELSALFGIANSYRAQELYDEAFTAVGQALNLAPDNVDALQLKGDLMADVGDFEASANTIARATKLAPRNVTLWRALGWALENRGNDYASAAQDAYRAALDILPDDPWAHKGLGNALRLAGERQLAEDEFERALGIFKRYIQNSDVLAQEGWCLYQLGRYEEALESLQRSAIESAQYFEQFDFALVQMCMGRLDEGLATYREGLSRIAKLSWRHQVGLLKIAADDIVEAIEEGRLSTEKQIVAELSSLINEKLTQACMQVENSA